jgi:hypothetical protein
MPTVSVIIPTYNRVDILPRAVESVLDQQYADFELLVVDDGSTDGTVSMLESYDDPRLRVISHETNEGASAARNTGIRRANGEFVAFLDSDDEWHPEKLQRQLKRYETAPPSCVAVYCDFEYELDGPTGELLTTAASVLSVADDDRPTEGGEELAGEILADHLQSGAGSTLLVETDTARATGGFDEQLDWFQDPDFLLRVIQLGSVAHVDEPLVTRYETGSPAASTAAQADARFLEKHESLVETAEQDGYRIEPAHELLLAKLYLQDGGFGEALTHLRNARLPPRHWPGVVWSLGSGLRNGSPGHS